MRHASSTCFPKRRPGIAISSQPGTARTPQRDFTPTFEGTAVGARGYRNAVIWITHAHRNDRRRFVTHADDKLTAFLELQRATHESSRVPNAE
jgi:hypothetical protein